MQDLETLILEADATKADWTGTHAVRVYTLDGIKDGTCRVSGDGDATVRTLDGTVSMRVRRTWAIYKLETGQDFQSC